MRFAIPRPTNSSRGASAHQGEQEGVRVQRADGEEVSLSVKLPRSAEVAAEFPFAEPTHYGLGQHGWITARIARGVAVPVDLLEGWIDESYRAVAPKTLVAQIERKRQR